MKLLFSFSWLSYFIFYANKFSCYWTNLQLLTGLNDNNNVGILHNSFHNLVSWDRYDDLNDIKWQRNTYNIDEMTLNDLKWLTMKLLEMIWNDLKWVKMTWNDLKWLKMTWNGFEWLQMKWL